MLAGGRCEFRRAGSHGSTSAKMADATLLEPALGDGGTRHGRLMMFHLEEEACTLVPIGFYEA